MIMQLVKTAAKFFIGLEVVVRKALLEVGNWKQNWIHIYLWTTMVSNYNNG